MKKISLSQVIKDLERAIPWEKLSDHGQDYEGCCGVLNDLRTYIKQNPESSECQCRNRTKEELPTGGVSSRWSESNLTKNPVVQNSSNSFDVV